MNKAVPRVTPAVRTNPFPGLRPFREDEEYLFSIDTEKAGEKDMWIEYVGLFDGMGTHVGEGTKLGISCGRSGHWRKGCSGDNVVDVVPVSRMDVVI